MPCIIGPQYGGCGGGASSSGPPVAPTAINKSLGDASGGTVVQITVASSTGLTGAKVCGVALTSFSIVDGTHVQGTTAAMTASATPGDVKVTNASGDSPALAGVFEAFWPTNIANCVQWLRADLGITIVGGKVTIWADQSGQGFNMTSALFSHPPDAPTTWTNGKLAIPCNNSHYGSAGDRLDNASPPAALTGLATNAAVEGFAIGQSSSTGVSGGEGLWYYGNGSAGWFPYTNGNDYENFCCNARPAGTGGGTYTVPWLYDIRVDGTAGTMFGTLNGTTVMNASGLGACISISGVCTILSATLGALDGKFAEAFIYTRILTSGERTRVNAYKADRYAF